MTSQYRRLLDHHPTAQKLDKLFAFMDEIGISIAVYQSATIINDQDFPHEVLITDLDHTDENVDFFPPGLEYVLKYENPEYKKEQEEQAKKDRERREAARKEAEEAARLAEEKRKRDAEEALRARELAELERLKKKYG
jgi:hypothetical protein